MKLFKKVSGDWANSASPSQPRPSPPMPALIPMPAAARLPIPMSSLPLPPRANQDEPEKTNGLKNELKVMREKNIKRNTIGDMALPSRLSERKRPRTDNDLVKPQEVQEPEFILPDISPPDDYLMLSSPPPCYESPFLSITEVSCPVQNKLQIVSSRKSSTAVSKDIRVTKPNTTVHIQIERIEDENTSSCEIVEYKSDTVEFDIVYSPIPQVASNTVAGDHVTPVLHEEVINQGVSGFGPIEIVEIDNLEAAVSDTQRNTQNVDNVPRIVWVPGNPPKLKPQDRVSKKEREDIINGKEEVPGIIPSLIDISMLPRSIPRKSNYLNAGLLSTYYKKPNEAIKMVDTSTVENMLASLDVSFPTQVVRPTLADLGGKVRVALDEPDYRLPYDIFCYGVTKTKSNFDEWIFAEENRRAEERRSMKQERRKIRDQVPIGNKGKLPAWWDFRKLRMNSYGGMSRPLNGKQEDHDHACECKDGVEMKCATDDCLNRVVFTECPESCGNECMNRRIQKHEWAESLSLFMTKNKGRGVKTFRPIKKGDFILEYIGEVVTAAEFRRRMSEVYANDTHHYCLQLDSGLVIDGHRSGDIGRFVNHSCEPNCEMQKWSVNGLHRMALFALQDILFGEELSYDYNFSLYNETEGQPCHCRSAKCRGIIGGKVKIKTPAGEQSQKGRKRKVEQSSASHSSNVIFFKGKPQDNNKTLSRREVKFVRSSNIFLVRNYYKVGIDDTDEEKETKEKLRKKAQKLMMAWSSRMFNASTKNKKELVLTGEDPKVAAIARTAKIFFDFYCHITTAKGKSSGRSLLCDPFMKLPLKSNYPVFHKIFRNTAKLNGLESIGKAILECNYESFQQVEDDFRVVVAEFVRAFETEMPETATLLDPIKDVYMEAKANALQVLEPFIEYSDSKHNQGKRNHEIKLPPFMTTDKNLLVRTGVSNSDEDEYTFLRCICGTFAEEGVLVQCGKCHVWQHCDCMRWPYNRAESEVPRSPSLKNRKRKFPTATCQGRGPGRPRKLILAEEKNSSSTNNSPKKTEECQAKPAMEAIDTKGNSDTNIDNSSVLIVDHEKEKITSPQNGSIQDAAAAMPLPLPENNNDSNDPSYYCEKCEPREVSFEIPMGGPGDSSDKTYYLTLLRDDGFLVRRNDTVYVLRDYPKDQRFLEDGTLRPRLTYRDAGLLVTDNCDILRVDSLWIDEDGNRMVMGYNYFRPNETFHERSRRFYPNEILRAPVLENINIEFIHGRCWVLDSNTYCMGRPIGSVEEHVYICDLRVDKTGRVFNKIGGKLQGICTTPAAFNKFVTKIKINRNVYPHGPPVPDFKVNNQIGKKQKPRCRSSGDDKQRVKPSLSEFEQRQFVKKKLRQKENLHAFVAEIRRGIKDFSVDPVDLSSLLVKDRKTRKSCLYKAQE